MDDMVEVEFRTKGGSAVLVIEDEQGSFTVKARNGIALLSSEQATRIEKHRMYGREFWRKKVLPRAQLMPEEMPTADRLREASDAAMGGSGVDVASKIREMAENAKASAGVVRTLAVKPVKEKNPNRVAAMQRAREIRDANRAKRAAEQEAAAHQQEGAEAS